MNKIQKLRGEVTWVFIKPDGTFRWHKQHNDILANARKVMLMALTNNGQSIDQIIVGYEATSITKEIQVVDFPAINQVQFQTLLAENEAVGTINSLILKSSDSGNFSWINTLEVEKPNELQLLINWRISLIPCEGPLPPPASGIGLMYQNQVGALFQNETGIYLNP